MRKPVVIGSIVLLAIVILFAVHYVPVWVDWGHFRNSGRALLNGQNPFDGDPLYFNAPWLAAIVIPFAVQDDATGNGLMFVAGFAAFAYIAYRFGARPIAFVAFLVSPGVISNQVLPNIEWVPLLGVLLEPRWGLLLLAVKPQVGAGVALIWLIQAWQAGRWQRVVKTFAPVSIALAGSVILYGFWFTRSLGLSAMGWNTSLFPWSLPIGAVVLWYALRRLRPDWAISATVLCSPYVSNPSWSGAFLSLARSDRAMVIASVAWWAVRLSLTMQPPAS